MHNRAAILILLSAALFFAACRKDLHDDDRPLATIVSPQGGAFSNAAPIPFNLQFTDNKNLLQYKLAFKYVGATYDTGDTLTVVYPFNYTWIEDIDGASINKMLDVVMHDSILPGEYQVSLTCVDEAGLESLANTTTITLKNKFDSIPPAFGLFNIGADSIFATTDSVVVSGSVSDADTLTHISYNIITDTPIQVIKATAQDYIKTSNYGIEKVLKWINFEAGNYLLVITVRDRHYNISQAIIPITIN